MIFIKGSALILEGGGMRGVFTAGVLDAFIQKEIEFPYVIGVSMGSYIGASYITKQYNRAFKVLAYSTNNKEFIDFRRILHGKSIVNQNFIFNNMDKELFPFHHNKFHEDSREFVSVTTNCFTGEPEYHYKKDSDKDKYERAIMASCAYPVLSSVVYLGGTPYLDDGISDSIPINYVLKKNKKKIIVILTHPKGFRESLLWYHNGSKLLFRNFPKIAKRILSRSKNYNESLELIEKLEKDNKIFVIRPSTMDMEVSETDSSKILRHHEMGFQTGLENIEKLKKWLEE